MAQISRTIGLSYIYVGHEGFVHLYFRLLGASVAIDAWFNPIVYQHPDLIVLKERAGIASFANVHPEVVYGDWIVCDKVVVERGALVGTKGFLLAGTKIPEGCTLGVMSCLQPKQRIPPGSALYLGGVSYWNSAAGNGSDWYKRIPRYSSTWNAVKGTSLHFIRSTLFPLLYIGERSVAIAVASYPLIVIFHLYGRWAIAAIPAAIGIYNLVASFLFILTKWIVVQRITSNEYPECEVSFFWHRWQLIFAMQPIVMRSMMGQVFAGSPIFSLYQKLHGMKIDGTTLLFTDEVTESDLIEIGSGSVIESKVCIQPHKWEAQSEIFGKTKIGTGCVMRPGSCSLYDVQMEDDVILEPTSLALPGQRLTRGGVFRGVPAVLTSRRSDLPSQPSSSQSRAPSSQNSNVSTSSSAALLTSK